MSYGFNNSKSKTDKPEVKAEYSYFENGQEILVMPYLGPNRGGRGNISSSFSFSAGSRDVAIRNEGGF